MKVLRLDSAARAELLHEVKYYEVAKRGLGRRFYESVQEGFTRVRMHPKSGSPFEAGTRQVRVNGFPFSLIYMEEEKGIVIFAVSHDKRAPGYWLDRLT